uniref:N-acetyltransferase domain-containing protein n=1 Tax=Heterosigma akashiwo TaxID=2829 RepID=A0A6V1LG73_HETAK
MFEYYENDRKMLLKYKDKGLAHQAYEQIRLKLRVMAMLASTLFFLDPRSVKENKCFVVTKIKQHYFPAVKKLSREIPDQGKPIGVVTTLAVVAIVQVVLKEEDGTLISAHYFPRKGRSPLVGTYHSNSKKSKEGAQTRRSLQQKKEEGKCLEPYIFNLVVRADERKKGLASMLLQKCEETAFEEWGRTSLYLHVDPKSTPEAYSWYQKSGYQKITSTRNKGHQSRGVYMVKRLSSTAQ